MPAPVPESKAKKVAQKRRFAAMNAATASALKKVAGKIRAEATKRNLKDVANYNAAQKELVNKRKLARLSKNYLMEADSKVCFVIRIRGIQAMKPKARKILQLLRLRQINNGVFVKMNHATLNMLRKVEPYITYGEPTRELVRKMVLKRGALKVNGQRILITDSNVVETALGKHGVHSVEDIVEQISNVGPKFREVSNTLWPIKLSHQNGGLKQKRRHFVEGGDWGNREQYINQFIKGGL